MKYSWFVSWITIPEGKKTRLEQYSWQICPLKGLTAATITHVVRLTDGYNYIDEDLFRINSNKEFQLLK